MSKAHDLLLRKVDTFTDTEFVALEAWLIAIEVNLYSGNVDEPEGLAGRVLRAGLDLEHYQSVLDPDPANWTPEQVESLDSFVKAFEEVMDEFRTSPKVRARMAVRDAGGRIFAAVDRVLRRFKR